MKQYLIYTLMLVAAVLTACKDKNEATAPADGDVITLSFSMENELADPAAAAPARLPGDPGKDDFINPSHLYFAIWVETGGKSYMKTCHLTGVTWTHVGNGIYQHTGEYKFKLPAKELTNATFYVFAYASSVEITTSPVFEGTYTAEAMIPETTTTLAELQALTYAISAGVTTEAAKRDFFRSMYSTALSETAHNQMATSPTIRLRHTAARLDINWECDVVAHPKGLTPNSTWTLALANNIMPTSFSLFEPGANTTGTQPWSETITIDEGVRYNGRYVTYLPMPTTPTFTVTSSTDAINPDGADATAKKTMSFPLSAGTDVNYATWMRALWTIK